MQNAPVKEVKEMVYVMANGDEMKLSIATVKKYLVQGHSDIVTDQEVLYFMHECKARKLNPFLRQCWLIKYSTKDNAQIVESIHHKRAKARAAPDCRGWKKGLILEDVKGQLIKSNGMVREGETVIGAFFEATPEGWNVPYELEINLNGYIKKKKDGSITQFWAKEKQPSQIMKVVESQGLSALWGGTIGTNYIPEELPSIDMEAGKNGQYNTAQAKIDKLKADEIAGELVDPGKPEDFEPEPETAQPKIWDKSNWNDLRKGNATTSGLEVWVNKHLEELQFAPNTVKAKLLDKWGRFYDKPFPVYTLPGADQDKGNPEKVPQTGPETPQVKDTIANQLRDTFTVPGGNALTPEGEDREPGGNDKPPPDDISPDTTVPTTNRTGFPETDAAIEALGANGPEIYEKAKQEINFPDGPFSDVTDKAIAARMSRIAIGTT